MALADRQSKPLCPFFLTHHSADSANVQGHTAYSTGNATWPKHDVPPDAEPEQFAGGRRSVSKRWMYNRHTRLTKQAVKSRENVNATTELSKLSKLRGIGQEVETAHRRSTTTGISRVDMQAGKWGIYGRDGKYCKPSRRTYKCVLENEARLNMQPRCVGTLTDERPVWMARG